MTGQFDSHTLESILGVDSIVEYNVDDAVVLRAQQFLTELGFQDFHRIQAPFSPFLLTGVDKTGQQWFIKSSRSDEPFKHREFNALASMGKLGFVPPVISLSGDDRLFGVKAIKGASTLNSLFFEKSFGNVSLDEDCVFPHACNVPENFQSWMFDLFVHSISEVHRLTVPDHAIDIANIVERRCVIDHAADADHARWLKNFQNIVGSLDQTDFTFVHGDTNFGNVLFDGRRLWLIDPYGLYGPPSFDLALPCSFSLRPKKAYEQMVERYDGPMDEYGELMLAWSCALAYRSMKHFGHWNQEHQRCVESILG